MHFILKTKVTCKKRECKIIFLPIQLARLNDLMKNVRMPSTNGKAQERKKRKVR